MCSADCCIMDWNMQEFLSFDAGIIEVSAISAAYAIQVTECVTDPEE